MAVTTSQIRDLLNRPRGLNEGTITEMISIRNTQVEKVSRGDNYGVAAENQIANFEMQRGNTVYIKTFCMEMDAFESQLKLKKNKGADA